MQQVISIKPVGEEKCVPLLTVQTRWITHLTQVGNTSGLLYIAFYSEPIKLTWEDYTRVFNVLYGRK